jgi:hypothetical protein
MITRQDVERLADFYSADPSAVTFYFVPIVPQDRSHRKEEIIIKDLIKDRLRSLTNGAARLKQDLEKVQQRAEGLRESPVAKAIFACSERGIWEEYDVEDLTGDTNVFIGRHFHLKPLVSTVNRAESVCIVLVDREVNRLLKYQNGKVIEDRFPEQDREPRDVRAGVGTGANTKDERRVGHEVMQHFKTLANHLLYLYERDEFDSLVIGGRPEMLPTFTQYLATPVQQVLIGTFHCDPGLCTKEQVCSEVERMVEERRISETQGLLREVTGESKRNGRGAVGLAKVLQSLERGEVQQLVVGNDFGAKGTLCPNCNHLESRMLDQCPACGTHMHEYDDITDVVIARAYGSKADVVVLDEPEFQNRIGALLRFRADQNTPRKLAS